MKKKTIQAKRQRTKSGNITPLNVSSMQGDDKHTSDVNHIIVGDQLGMPEETKKTKKNKRPKPLTGMDLVKKRISFADFRKQSRELNYGRDSI